MIPFHQPRKTAGNRTNGRKTAQVDRSLLDRPHRRVVPLGDVVRLGKNE